MTTHLKPSALALLSLLEARPAGVTALEVLEEIGSFRASGRVLELRQAGYPVETRMVRTPSGKRIAMYRLPSRRKADAGTQQAAGL